MSETTIISKPRQKFLAQRLLEKRIADATRTLQAKEDWKREQTERERTMPTPQRIQKRDVEYKRNVDGDTMAYKPKRDVLETYKDKWQPEMEVAFHLFASDAEAAVKSGASVTMNYGGAGGASSPATRFGGLGAAHVEQIAKYHRFNWVMDRLTGRSRRVCEFILLGSKDGTLATATLEEVGRWIFPHLKDKNSSRMIGLGRFLGCGDELVKLYGDFQLEHRFAEARVKTMRTVNS